MSAILRAVASAGRSTRRPPAHSQQHRTVALATFACIIAACGLAGGCIGQRRAPAATDASRAWTFDQGGIVRGDPTEKRIALIFTGGEYGEGTAHILNTLHRAGIKASFFVTGQYLAKEEYQPLLRRMVAEGHYVGPHSDSHPLYCAWDDRAQTLVTEIFFKQDLWKNIADLRRFGALPEGTPIYFIPPYEWFNADQVRWAGEMGLTLFNFTPGSGSNRDWIPEGERAFVSSEAIRTGILAYEQKHPHGLNGFLLLLHLGAKRQDKMHAQLETLIEALSNRGYAFARVDEMLKPTTR